MNSVHVQRSVAVVLCNLFLLTGAAALAEDVPVMPPVGVKVGNSSATVGGATTTSPAKKSGYNTKVYETEISDKSFTSLVKIVREVRGSWEVLFTTKPGVFTVDENQQAPLAEAMKDKTAVLVHYNEDNNHITSAQEVKKKPVKGP